LLRQIASRREKLGVIGLGYVGIPLALIAARAGFPVQRGARRADQPR
jgi:UDP-N-acetyl-D-glucosamine dehydrogenase